MILTSNKDKLPTFERGIVNMVIANEIIYVWEKAFKQLKKNNQIQKNKEEK